MNVLLPPASAPARPTKSRQTFMAAMPSPQTTSADSFSLQSQPAGRVRFSALKDIFTTPDARTFALINAFLRNDKERVEDLWYYFGSDYKNPNILNLSARTQDGTSILIAAFHNNANAEWRRDWLIDKLDTFITDKKGPALLINAINNNGWTALMKAAITPNIDPALIEMLVNLGADVKKISTGGSSLLQLAIFNKHPENVPALISAGVDLDNQDKYGQNALMTAINNDDKASLITLINTKKVDLNLPNRIGNTALLDAINQKKEAFANLLIDAGADLNISDKDGETPLIKAIKTGHDALAQKLISAGAKLDLTDKYGNAPLDTALNNNRFEVIQAIAQAGYDLSTPNRRGFPALSSLGSMESDQSERLKVLLDAGADVHAHTPHKDTALHWSVFRGKIQETQVLLQYGADPTIQNFAGCTALSLAEKKPEILQLLKKYQKAELTTKRLPAAEFIQRMLSGRSLMEAEAVVGVILDRDYIDIFANQIKTYVGGEAVNKAIAEKALCRQYYNSSGPMHVFLEKVCQKAFALSPEDLAKRHPELAVFLQEAMTPEKQQGPAKGFARVAGMAKLKQLLQEGVIGPIRIFQRMDRAELPPKLKKSNGILFYGPPGCGKTYFGVTLAEEINYAFIPLNAEDFESKYVGETGTNLLAKIQEAKDKAPSLLLMDEIDSLASKVSEMGADQNYDAKVSNLLKRVLDGLGESDVLVVATTNNLDKIDGAIKRTGRFDRKYFIPPPDTENRIAVCKDYVKGYFPIQFEYSEEQYQQLAALTQNYAVSDFELIFNDTFMAIQQKITNGTLTKMDANANAYFEELLNKARSTKSSIQLEDLLPYTIELAELGTPLFESESKPEIASPSLLGDAEIPQAPKQPETAADTLRSDTVENGVPTHV